MAADQDVLIIDSDPIQAGQIQRVLTAHGVAVRVSESAAQGIAAMAERAPDLAIVSSSLSDRSGFGVCRHIRRDPQLRNTPVILSARDVTRRALERHSRLPSRAQTYLMTPFSGFELWRQVQAVFAGQSGGAGRILAGNIGPGVILIDPNEDSVNTLKQLLTSRGCTAVIAASPTQVLSLSEQRHPDLIIVSVELNTGSGFGVCKKLRRHPALSNVPVFLVSAEASDEVLANHRKLRSRATAYFRKPYAADALWAEIEKYLPLTAPAPDGPAEIG